MRKTFLTVEAAFPYVKVRPLLTLDFESDLGHKTRLRVESSREEVLSPLELANESIQNKVRYTTIDTLS